MQNLRLKVLSIIITAGVLVSGWLLLSSKDRISVTNGAANDGKISIVATIYPLAFFATDLDPNATVTTIVGSGKEPHDYEPTIEDAKALHDAELLIINGNVDDWAADAAADRNFPTISALAMLNLPSSDPHVWLDPVYAQAVVRIIGGQLASIDPTNAEIIAQNVDKKVTALAALDQSFKDGLANCELHEVVSAHEAFSFLADRYSFKAYGITGMNPESEPSAADLARMTDLIRDHHIPTVFFESLISPALSKTLAEETGANSDVLDAIESLAPGANAHTGYTDAMLTNLGKLRSAMLCQ
jgi:zinc transport system substrate-binding protein